MTASDRQTPPAMTARGRLAGGWDWAAYFAMAYAAVYLLWVFFHWGGEENVDLIANLANIPISFLAAAAALRVAADRLAPPGLRRAWLALGLAIASSAVAEVLWFYVASILKVDAFPSVADIFYFLFYPLVLLGLAIFPNAPLSREARAKFWLDLGIVGLVAGLYVWNFVVAPTLAEAMPDLLSQALATAYPLGDFMTIMGIAILILRRVDPAVRDSLLVFALGLVAFAGADLYFGYASLTTEFTAGSWLDAGYVIGYALFAVAAIRQRRPAGGLSLAAEDWAGRLALVLPFASLAAGYGLAFYEFAGASSLTPTLRTLLVGALALAVLVALRQVLELRENRLLSMRLRATADEFRGLSDSLEARVRERIHDLTLVTEINQLLGQFQDQDALLDRAVDLIQQHFDLYHVQIYLLSANGRTLQLRASTGPAGRALLAQQHRLPVDVNSVNGQAAAGRKSILVTDARLSASFRPNPLLSETHSELAVPLLFGERLLGVLDLQSSQPDGLNADNEGVFLILADQLAIAMENSTLFTEVEQARASVETQAQRLLRSHWQEYLDDVERRDLVEATYGAAEEASEHAPALAAPIALIGEGLGQLRVEGEAGQVWSPEDDELLQTAARLLAQRLENLRLLAQAEQYRGEAERALRRLTREGWRDYLDTAQLQPAYEYADGQVTAAPDPAPAGPLVAEPLVVQGEPVGEIGVEAEALPPEAEALVAAVAAQLSAHIENLRLGEATQLALAETEELYRITAQLNAAPAIPDVIGVLAGLNAAAAGGLFLLEADASGRPGSLVYTAGWPQPNPRLGPLGTRLPLESFPEAAYWREHPQEPLLVGDLEKDARVHAATRALYQQLGVRAAAFLPLGLAGRWTGLVTLSWLKPRAFSAQDEQVYQAAAAQAAVVINNRVLFEQTRKRADREAVINAITQRIQGTVTVQGALETAIQELGQALQARRASVALAVTPGAAGPGPDAPAANGHDGAGAEK